MKRAAEKQLSKDDLEEDVEETEGQQGFQKADEDTLATRKIRGLPRRSTAPSIPVIASPSTDSPAAPAPASKFGSFQGFGTPGSTHSFTFTPPESPASGLGVSPPASLNPSPAPVFGNMSTFKAQPFVPPVIAPPPSSAAKTIGSIIQKPPSFKPAEVSGGPSSAAQKYYTSLRGLNKSFIDAVTKAYADDPLADWSETHFETYKKHLFVLKTAFDTAEATKQKVAPPTIFSSAFGKPQPAAAPAPAGESAPKPPPSTSAPAPSIFPPPSSSAPKSNGLLFPSSSTPFSGTSGSDNRLPFSFSKPTNADATNASGPSLAPSPFGLKGSSSSFAFGASSDFKDASKAVTAGGAVTTEFFATPPATAPPSSGSLSGFAAFGKPASSGSIGNPVGFGFGATSKDSNLGVKSEEDKTEDDAAQEGSKPDGEETVPPPILLANSPHDEEGEGEEDEETTYSIKAKTYWMNKDAGKWQDMGHGVLRLKKHKEKGTRRVLQRNSSTGKINLNFNLYPGLKPTVANKAISFIGHDENGVAQSYSVRTKTEDQLHALRDALEREISFVKAKEE
ncbi:hypothetical protein ARMSODRAFT_952933 [Armillaria solidipes]|uniref:RanBD1 domain-containing protein n=1 Tax=Armillaria solidipes TaxID=1076256 RepID=A0A2H3C6C3_9AGAR|nr:hypothetical protein ARMSODRAFT_952933 [Armillaria solidipes]